MSSKLILSKPSKHEGGEGEALDIPVVLLILVVCAILLCEIIAAITYVL
jgi:hypothetical protein